MILSIDMPNPVRAAFGRKCRPGCQSPLTICHRFFNFVNVTDTTTAMRPKFILVLASALLFVTGNAHCQLPERLNLSPHPRLVAAEPMSALLDRVKSDSVLSRMHDYVVECASGVLNEPVCERKKQGRRLLHVSRKVLERVLYCSYVYRMTGDEAFLRRAEEEMLAAAEFEDWNPSHFLDVGEMTAALAIGYDWLYDALPQPSRDRIARAIIYKGLLGADRESQMWFYRATNNWNQVCNAGLAMGALAVWELEPELCRSVIGKALETNPRAMRSYAPDGVYPEGFGYWSYGTWYQVLLIESLRSALGFDSGLEEMEGFMRSAEYMNFMVTPTHNCFNFSDSGPRADINGLLFWFAAESGDTSLVRMDCGRLKNDRTLRFIDRRLLPFAILFAARCDLGNVPAPKRDFWYGRGAMPLFIYRSGCGPEDAYLAAKGGSPSHSHAHMDGGSFIYEQGGVRWAVDLGMQDYYSLERSGVKLWSDSQESQRWSVFRLSAGAHNTVTVDDGPFRCAGMAEMTEIIDTDSLHGAEFDLTTLLFGVESAVRRITVDGGGTVRTEDTVKAEGRPRMVRWTMNTTAEPRIIDDRTIELVSGDRRLVVRACSDRKTEAFILSNDPPHDYDAPNPGTCRVGFTMKAGVRKAAKLTVELVPVSD